ncbi:MAG TPA: MerR family transcriptional regulator [Ktedonobacteraceae bacterium]|nr:MerR family transcriptional regulator [Ktedonobacteraceae bacterium]
MLKIRDFAEIAQVSASTLRYYDEIGIFEPIQVDPDTGYRFYSLDQLPRLNRILALRDLGLDLTQIAQLLEEVSTEALQGMLRLRQAKLQQHIQAEQEQLARIEARLNYLELKGQKLAHEVVLKDIKALTGIASYTHVNGFLPNVCYANTFLTLLKQHGMRQNGPLIYLYHESISGGRDVDVELFVPIEHEDSRSFNLKTERNEAITICELPEVPKMASVIYHGSPHAIVEAYQTLGIWIVANGYTITGPQRKVCLRWNGELSDYLTEIQFPVGMGE